MTIEAQQIRRRSEGDTPNQSESAPSNNSNDSLAQQRRISLDSSESKSATAGNVSVNVKVKWLNVEIQNAK